MSSPATTPLVPLCQMTPGALGRVRELVGPEDFCQRVREMGLGESTFVTKVSGEVTVLCQVEGNRIALSHRAAKGILVELMGRR